MGNKKNILIVGSSAGASAFVKIIKNYDNVGKIYLTGKFFGMGENVEFIDIRETDVNELLKFAFEHDVNLTVVFSLIALKADIADVFNANGQVIFAPEYEFAKYFFDKSLLKKLLYKNGVKIPQFGIFDKQQKADEYLKTAKLPVIISSLSPISEKDIYACPVISLCNIALNDLFFKGEEKVLIDEYVSGHNFTTYLITDGVSVLPLGTLSTGKFSDDYEGGFYTTGSWAGIPDNKITKELEEYIVYDVWEKISASLNKGQDSCSGIIGISGVLKDDEIFITDINIGINPVDAAVLLNSLDENLVSLFEACAIGSFTDDYDFIKTNDLSYISLAVFSNTEGKEMPECENIDYISPINSFNNGYLTRKGLFCAVWAEGSTMRRAKQKMAEDIKDLEKIGLKYRKDVLKNIEL